MAAILVFCGSIALLAGGWRSWTATRSALLALTHDGEPTRRLVEAARPFHRRGPLRTFLRDLIVALLWLVVALYGLVLLVAGGLRP
jgi:hypothetical protein